MNAHTTWVDECMAKQRREIPKCDRCHKTTGRGHCNECGGCRPKISADVQHEAWCSRS